MQPHAIPQSQLTVHQSTHTFGRRAFHLFFPWRAAPLLLALALNLSPAQADVIVPWGNNSFNQATVPPGLTDVTAVAAGGGHNTAILPDRTVESWGYNPYGQLDVPPSLGDVIAVAAGYDHSLALRSNGTVVGWGRNLEGQTNVPPGLSGVVAVSANGYASLALKSDGTVVAWGDNTSGQGNVPAGLGNVAAISSGPAHHLALRRDGTVVAWGRNDFGQTNVPPGLTGVVEVAAGGEHSLARKADGTVVSWGRDNLGQANVAGIDNVVALAAGFAHTLFLKSDGLVVARGWNDHAQATVPTGLAGVRSISAGYFHSVALVGDQDGPPTISCPADVNLTCATCNIDPANTGTATATGQGQVLVSHTDSVTGDCPKVVKRTWTARDESGQTASCVQTITCREDPAAVVITCPPARVLVCTDCNTDPANTGVATATGTGTIRVSYQDEVGGECPKVVRRTWTARDDSGQSDSCVQTITCREEPGEVVIACPPDRVLVCTDCNTDPANTGVATATGTGAIRISYQDQVRGECPKVVTRIWSATDEAANTARCTQTISCVPASVVTGSSLCGFDRDLSTPIQDFRLIFTQDPANWPCYRLTASNPGQFSYNIFQTGTPGQKVTFDVTVPYPFVTQGSNPIHAYDWVRVDPGDRPCFEPGKGFFASSRQVTLASYGSTPKDSVTLPITLTVPKSGVVFLAIHLDYGLKKRTGFTKNLTDDAVDCATGLKTLIPNGGVYSFAVSGAQAHVTAVGNQNTFKRNPGVGGLVRNKISGDPVEGTLVTLATARGVPIGSRMTDEDGFFFIAHKHTGKAATYGVSILTPAGYRETKNVTLKANRTLHVEFLTP